MGEVRPRLGYVRPICHPIMHTDIHAIVPRETRTRQGGRGTCNVCRGHASPIRHATHPADAADGVAARVNGRRGQRDECRARARARRRGGGRRQGEGLREGGAPAGQEVPAHGHDEEHHLAARVPEQRVL